MSKVNLGAGGRPTRTIRRSDPEKRESVRTRAAAAPHFFSTPWTALKYPGRVAKKLLNPKRSDAMKTLTEDRTEGGGGLSEDDAKRALERLLKEKATKRMRGGGRVKKTGVRRMRGGGMAKKRKK